MATVTWVDARGWSDALATVRADVYFTPGYHALHEEGGVTPVCAVVTSAEHRLVVPGCLHPIGDGTLSDLQTPNGYGGPLATPDIPSSVLEECWAAWRAQAAARGIVAAFFRLHPVLDNARWTPSSATVIEDRETVLVDLGSGLDHAYRCADSRFRNKVKRAERDGLGVRWNAAGDWPLFERVYAAAMDRLGAVAGLRFGSAYFAKLKQLDVDLGVVEENGEVAASAVFLRGDTFHYHLGARAPLPENRANTFLFHEAMRRAVASGATAMHVGGGATRAESDTLLRFKRLMSPLRKTFSVARVIADPVNFEALLSDWQKRSGRAPAWLLGYREPVG